MTWKSDSHSYVYILLSLVFIIINVITIENLLPWIDEVMFLDTSYNAAFHGSWSTTAWYRVAGQYPFSTYPPLYQSLVTLWMWLFGPDLLAVRSFNIAVVFVLGALCLRMLKIHGVRLTLCSVVLFTFLLWGTEEMAWMYRNGRPDLLCALVFVMLVQSIDNFLLKQSVANRLAVVMLSALVLFTGVQTVAYLGVSWLFLFIVLRKRRRDAFSLLLHLSAGILFGLLLVCLFMFLHGRLIGFLSSIVSYSATLSKIALILLPCVGDLFGFSAEPYIQKLLEQTTNSSIGERLTMIVSYRSFLILSVLTFVSYIVYFRRSLQQLRTDKGFVLFLFALFVPVMMTLAGRFAIYYRWMAFLPLLMAIMFIVVKHRVWQVVFGVTAVLLTFFGVKSMLPRQSEDYAQVRQFVARQEFKPSDAVVCPFMLFYEIKPLCDTCYFVGIFPTEFVGNVDYIIEAPQGNEFDRPISSYVRQLASDTNVVLTKIDSCEHPSLLLYKVNMRYE